MSLKYREDKGLAVLALADDGDLERLADLLTYDETDGNLRLAQELLDESAFVQARAESRVGDAWQLIAAELQTFGGDGVANRIRSIKGDHTGVPYQEILEDIAKYVGADLKAADGVSGCEAALIQKMLLERYLPKTGTSLSPHARSAAREFDRPALVDGTLDVQKLQDLLRDDEDFFLAAIAILRRIPQFAVATSVAATAFKKWAMPGGGVQSVTGPALRITVPAMLEVARIRRKALRNPLNLAGA
jgi:uncharacterized protein YaaW (UPF0174 family)